MIKKFSMYLLILVFILGLIFSFVEADILSINSGGDNNLTITSVAEPQPLPLVTQNQTNQSNPPPVIPPITPISGLSVNPTAFNLSMLVNTNILENFSVTNLGNTTVSFNITQTNLTNFIIIGNPSVSLNPGQTQIVTITFVAPGTVGVYSGSINVGNIIIPVSLNVVKQFILFDTNVVVLNKGYKVQQGSPLQTEVTLIPMGGSVRMDVTLNYAIKNSNGTIFLTRNETLLVQSEQNLRRDFDTGSLPLGNYTVDLELIYPNGVAPSSAYFEVVSNTSLVVSQIIYYLILGIIVVIILIIITLLIRYLNRIRYKSKFSPNENPNPVSNY